MKRVVLPFIVVAVLIGLALASVWVRQADDARAVHCVDPVAGCGFEHAGAPARLQFSTQPVPLEAFRIDVVAPGVDSIAAEFQMQGMEMGFNRYDLKRRADGVSSAEVTLPVCVSGRHDWTLYLTLDGRRYAVPFATYR